MDDISPLEQLSEEILYSPAYLFDIRPATVFNLFSHKGNLGHKVFVAPNPPFGAMISYFIREDAKDIRIIIKDAEGHILRELKGAKEAGINMGIWNMRYSVTDTGGAEQQSRYFRASGPFALPGEYQVVLNVGDQEMVKSVRIEGDPRVEVAFDERKKKQDTLLRIHSHFPLIAAVQRRSGKISKEISVVKRALKNAADVRKILLGDRSLGWRGMAYSVRGRLFMLSRSLSGFTGAPSERQILQLDRASTELNDLIQRMNRVIEEEIPELNRLLNENNVPHLFAGEPIKK